MTLGEHIKQLRQDAGLTQPELAVKAGIEQSYLSKLENDKGSPSFDIIAKIAGAFDLDAMNLIDRLDIGYLNSHLAHLPEIAVKLEQRKKQQMLRFKKGYSFAALLIVLGIALVLLGKSNTIFPERLYQYKSMGLIYEGELNRHYSSGVLHEINENREQREQRIEANVARIDEMLVLTRNYQGEAFVEGYGKDRRYFELIDERPSESPWRDVFVILGFILLSSGGFGLGYVFKFMAKG